MNAVLLIHGFPFDHSMWRHQLAALSRWECMAPDLRGFGAAEVPAAPDEYSMAAYAADLVRLLDERRVDSVVACGLSMGGYIVFELLRQVPKRLRGAILCNTKAPADTPEARRGRDALAVKAGREGASGVGAELLPKLLARVTRERRPDVVREVTAMIARQPVPGIVGALRALRDRPDSTELLGRIDVPVLVVAGEDDQITPAAEMQQMASAIPGAEFVRIRDAGHLTPLEQPEACSSVINNFIATTD